MIRAVAAVMLLLPRIYTATASFMPQVGEGQASRLAGLAAQFGVSVPTGEAGQTPRFYADLLRSRELLKQTALAEYRLVADGGGQPIRGDLIALLEIEADTPPWRWSRRSSACGGSTLAFPPTPRRA